MKIRSFFFFWRGEIDKSFGNSGDPEQPRKYLESDEVEGHTLPDF